MDAKIMSKPMTDAEKIATLDGENARLKSDLAFIEETLCEAIGCDKNLCRGGARALACIAETDIELLRRILGIGMSPAQRATILAWARKQATGQ